MLAACMFANTQLLHFIRSFEIASGPSHEYNMKLHSEKVEEDRMNK